MIVTQIILARGCVVICLSIWQLLFFFNQSIMLCVLNQLCNLHDLRLVGWLILGKYLSFIWFSPNGFAAHRGALLPLLLIFADRKCNRIRLRLLLHFRLRCVPDSGIHRKVDRSPLGKRGSFFATQRVSLDCMLHYRAVQRYWPRG